MENSIDLKTDTQMVWRGGSVQVRISTSRELGAGLFQGRSPLDAEAMQKGFGRRARRDDQRAWSRPDRCGTAGRLAGPAFCLRCELGSAQGRRDPSGAPQGEVRKDSDGQGYSLEYAIPWSLLEAGAAAPTRRRDVWGLLAGPLGRRNRPRMEGTPGGHHRVPSPASPTSVPTTGVPRSITPAAIFLRARSGHEPVYWTDAIMPPILRLEIAVGPSNRIAVSMRPPVNGSVSTFHRMETDMRDRTSRESVCFTSFAVMSAWRRRSSSRLRSYRQLSKPLRPLLLSLGRNAYFIGECVPLAFRSATGPMILEVVGKRELTGDLLTEPARRCIIQHRPTCPWRISTEAELAGEPGGQVYTYLCYAP